MKRELKKWSVVNVLFFWVLAGFAQTGSPLKYGNTIRAEDLKKHLQILASDEYEGRETGENGQKKAATYLIDYFKALNFPLVNGSYFQSYRIVNIYPDTVQITINGKSFSKAEDFYFYRGFNDTSFTTQSVVFAGYGIDDEKYSDFENVDVKGKVVLIIKGEPKKKNKFYLTRSEEPSQWTKNWKNVLKNLKQKGAIAVFVVRPDYDLPQNKLRISHYMSKPVTVLEDDFNKPSAYMPYFYISPRMANEILSATGKDISSLKKTIDKKFKPQSFEINHISVSVKMNRKKEIKTGDNILGYIEGTDKKEEVIILTAHYDHIGKHDTIIYNGADDDGSGTVALLEIAAAFKRAKDEGFPIKRSVLIMLVSGEEKGLLGSEYYSNHPVFPLENTVADINIDMIGRIDEAHRQDTNYVYVIGSDMLSSELHRINEEVNKQYTQLKLDYTYNSKDDPNRFYYRSDHYNFAKHNIPSIFFFNGVHEDYHQPTDTEDKIHYELLERRTRLAFYLAWELANREERIKADKIEENAKP